MSQFLTVDVAAAALGPRDIPDFQFMESSQGDLGNGFNDVVVTGAKAIPRSGKSLPAISTEARSPIKR